MTSFLADLKMPMADLLPAQMRELSAQWRRLGGCGTWRTALVVELLAKFVTDVTPPQRGLASPIPSAGSGPTDPPGVTSRCLPDLGISARRPAPLARAAGPRWLANAPFSSDQREFRVAPLRPPYPPETSAGPEEERKGPIEHRRLYLGRASPSSYSSPSSVVGDELAVEAAIDNAAFHEFIVKSAMFTTKASVMRLATCKWTQP